MVCVEILAGIALLILFVWMERLREEREEELVRRIRSSEMAPAASGRGQPEEPEQALEYEIAKLFERLEAEEHYLQEKNLMTQNFIENIAHQIKTPLSCISISQERILEGTEGEARELAQQSLRYTDEIGKLMKRLLDIGRLEAGKVIWHREMFRMADLLEDCAASLEDGTERILTMGDREAEYYGDYEWLKEAFSNILKNCLEHDASGEKITASLTQSREGIKIVIRDHGPGISEKDLPHIFDRFYLPEKTGTSHVGIGLNLARLVIEQHFGTVAARNAEGRVIMYADEITGSMKRAIDETERRRAIQDAYNREHGIVPKTIIKDVKIDLGITTKKKAGDDIKMSDIPAEIEKLKALMKVASAQLDFERAIEIRDEISQLKKRMMQAKK